MEYGLYHLALPLNLRRYKMNLGNMSYTHFVHRLTGTIVLVNTLDEKEMKKYSENADYYQYFLLVK